MQLNGITLRECRLYSNITCHPWGGVFHWMASNPDPDVTEQDIFKSSVRVYFDTLHCTVSQKFLK